MGTTVPYAKKVVCCWRIYLLIVVGGAALTMNDEGCSATAIMVFGCAFFEICHHFRYQTSYATKGKMLDEEEGGGAFEDDQPKSDAASTASDPTETLLLAL